MKYSLQTLKNKKSFQRPSATTTGVLGVSLSYPILNLKEMV